MLSHSSTEERYQKWKYNVMTFPPTEENNGIVDFRFSENEFDNVFAKAIHERGY
jgi:hypothetical protein